MLCNRKLYGKVHAEEGGWSALCCHASNEVVDASVIGKVFWRYLTVVLNIENSVDKGSNSIEYIQQCNSKTDNFILNVENRLGIDDISNRVNK